MLRRLVMFGAVLSTPAAAQQAAPQEAAPPAPLTGRALEERTRAVASQLRCPVCRGLSIQDSPADLAQEMRAVVRERLAAGHSPDEVKRYFVEKYGEWVLLEPKPQGFNLAVYVLPLLALLAGAAVVVVAVRRWTRPVAAGAHGGPGEGAGEEV